jgi:hypothetical protein
MAGIWANTLQMAIADSFQKVGYGHYAHQSISPLTRLMTSVYSNRTEGSSVFYGNGRHATIYTSTINSQHKQRECACIIVFNGCSAADSRNFNRSSGTLRILTTPNDKPSTSPNLVSGICCNFITGCLDGEQNQFNAYATECIKAASSTLRQHI